MSDERVPLTVDRDERMFNFAGNDENPEVRITVSTPSRFEVEVTIPTSFMSATEINVSVATTLRAIADAVHRQTTS